MNELKEKFKMTLHIATKEFKSYFISPVAYIVIVVFLLVQGWFFFMPFFLKNQAEMRDFFSLLPIIFVFIIPAITMRQFAEEINTGSFELLATLPIKYRDIVLGKFLATVVFIKLLLLPTLFYAFTISILGDLDWGPVIGGYIGAVLLGSAYASIGLLTSTFTKNQIIAFIIAVSLCFALWFIDKVLVFMPDVMVSFFQMLGTDYHFQNIAKGVVDFRDLLYFISVTFMFLYAAELSIQEKN